MKSKTLYTYGDDPATNLLYFTLDSSRREPAPKRVNIIMSAGTLTNDERIRGECYELASELMDVEQIVQRHIALVRETYAAELTENNTWRYVLEKIEDQTLEIKADLLASLVVFPPHNFGTVFESWKAVDGQVRRYGHRFDTFLFKLRTRFYEGSNRDARNEMELEEKMKQSRKAARKLAKNLRKASA